MSGLLPQGPLCRHCGHVMSHPEDHETGAHTMCAEKERARADQT